MAPNPHTNLPPNEDPRPQVGSVVSGSPMQTSPSSVPAGSPSGPPPLPELKFNSPILESTRDSVVSLIKDFVKNNVTINGEQGSLENGRVNYSVKPASPVHMGPTTSQDTRSGSNVSRADQNNEDRVGQFKARQSSPGESHMEAPLEKRIEKSFEDREADDKKADVERQARLDPNRPLASTRQVGLGDPQQALSELNRTDRLQGESGKDYEDRRKAADEIKQLKDGSPEKAEALNKYAEKALGNVSLASLLPESFIPICVTRADGRTKSLIYVKSAATISATAGVTRDVSDYFDGYTHPFKVVVRKDGGTTKAGVIYYSHLFDKIGGDQKGITGLLSYASDSGSDVTPEGSMGSPPDPPAPNAAGVSQPDPPSPTSTGINGWLTVSDGDFLWLEISISDGSVTTAEIKKGSAKPQAVEGTGEGAEYKQTKASKVLAKMVNGFAEQYVTTNLVMIDMCIDGKGALYPIPN